MINNNIAITGFTKGIGKGIFDYYQKENNVLGFSRSNGYDLSTIESIDNIINQTINCNIFFNNAYYNDSQTIIAKKWFDLHKDKTHLLVNISSISPIADQYLDSKHIFKEYSFYKSNLDKISWDINFSNYNSKCINISPAIVNTKMAHPFYITKFKSNSTVISVDDIVNIITKLVSDYFTNKWFTPHIFLMNNDHY